KWTLTGNTNIVIDGFTFSNDLTTVKIPIEAQSTGTTKIVNNIFTRGTSSTPSGNFIAIERSWGNTGTLIVDNNKFTTPQNISNPTNNKAWTSGIWYNGGGRMEVTNNVFEKLRAAINFDNFQIGHVVVFEHNELN